MKILDTLNPKQKEAVLYNDGPLLILAGAGSGKTKTITHKIAYLLMEGKVSPYGFLAMTFTNKAAQEMKNRILKLGASIPQNIWVGTFHALCARILRKHAELIGYDSNFNIIDKHDQSTLVRECLKELNIGEKSIKPFSVLAKIDHLKNNGLSLEKARKELTNYNFIDKKIF